ncbi:MAG: FAD-dependent oxidoreductase, partial [Deltaproteobacteria bacterium]|nr:FAD-dependent oxidoreductase [Deltaproteobacteria bacterium]
MRSGLELLETDVLVVGGGAAGCAAAIEARESHPELRVVVVEKAHVSRSGCLAMGLNAVNAYLPDGRTPQDYVEAVRTDAHGVFREDLVRTLAEELNAATHRVESWGLPIPRDARGKPYSKGPNSIRVLGEALKPILAGRLRGSGATVLNRHTLLDLWVSDGRVSGALFLGVRTGKLLAVKARAVILATGGASGLYRTQNRGDALNRMWYSPFNAGAGYAAALRAGAELTTLE